MSKEILDNGTDAGIWEVRKRGTMDFVNNTTRARALRGLGYAAAFGANMVMLAGFTFGAFKVTEAMAEEVAAATGDALTQVLIADAVERDGFELLGTDATLESLESGTAEVDIAIGGDCEVKGVVEFSPTMLKESDGDWDPALDATLYSVGGQSFSNTADVPDTYLCA